MSWLGAIASGFAGGFVSGISNAAVDRGHPEVEKRLEEMEKESRQPSEDPRWVEAKDIREMGKQAQAEGREHVDNAIEAGMNGRVFEAARETTEVAKSALEAQERFHEANRVEWEAAKDAAANGKAGDCIVC